MNKTILAVALTTLLSGAAHAATVYKNDNGDNIKVYGGAEVGGWVANDTPDGVNHGTNYVDDSFATIGLKGQTGDFFAKFELDAERTPWTDDNNFQFVIDKVYVGYNLAEGHSIELGRTDTAYDHFDSFGDFSVNEAAGVSEAGDQDNTIKYRGQFGNIQLGVSYSMEGNDYEEDIRPVFDKDGNFVDFEDKGSYKTDSRFGEVYNGYIGYFTDQFTVIAGAETVEDRGEIYSLHGEANFGKVGVGGFVSHSDRDSKGKDTTTYLASGSYDISKQLQAVATFSHIDAENSKNNDSWGTIGMNYQYAKNVKLSAEIATGGDAGTYGYAKTFFWF